MNTSKLLLFAAMLLFCKSMNAQQHKIYSNRIASLQVVADDKWLEPPIIVLGSNERIHISFDDLTHEYHRYVYRLQHCDAEWKPSDQLFETDYADGFTEGNVIEDVAESENTNTLYSHYSLSIPNSQCRPKISGNYTLTVYDENNDDEEILTACFMIVEPIMGVSLSVSGNTDWDIHGRHQQVSMAVSYGRMQVSNAEQQIKTVLMQNYRWSTARRNVKPQYINSDGLKWEHCRQYIFDGWNEYHKFEVLDVDHTTMGLERIDWDGSWYHAFVWTDEPHANYIYDEDANGAFYIRNSDNLENDIWSEYVQVHFRLFSDLLPGVVYVNGIWTLDRYSDRFRMHYNHTNHCYEAVIPLKQGYYSYQYVWKTANGNLQPVPSEGNFYQTENSYQALVYYRHQSDRTDRLVGYSEIHSR